MTAAKGSSGKAAAKGKPAKVAAKPAKAAARPQPKAATAKPAAAKLPVTKPAPAAKTAAPPAKPAAKAAPAVASKTAPAQAKPTATKAVAPKAAAKGATPGRKGRGDSGSEANLHKRVDSERIALHIAAFEKSGGRVEKLGVTRVLQKVSEVAATAPAQAVKSGSRRR